MPKRVKIALAVLLVAIVGVIAWETRSRPTQVQIARFIGLTNGVVGVVPPTFAALSTNNARLIQQWLAAGTNGAVFCITNLQKVPISVFPIARFVEQDSQSRDDESPLLNAPSFSGIVLQPGQTATLQVAVLPHHGAWKVIFICFTHQGNLLQDLVTLPKNIVLIITRKPFQAPRHTIESDWITP